MSGANSIETVTPLVQNTDHVASEQPQDRSSISSMVENSLIAKFSILALESTRAPAQ